MDVSECLDFRSLKIPTNAYRQQEILTNAYGYVLMPRDNEEPLTCQQMLFIRRDSPKYFGIAAFVLL